MGGLVLLRLADEIDTQVHNAWTTEEDAIFLEVVGSLLKSGIWPAVKEDGRLTHRGGTGVKAHCTALVRGSHLPLPLYPNRWPWLTLHR